MFEWRSIPRIEQPCPVCTGRKWMPVVRYPTANPHEYKCGTPDCEFTVDARIVNRLGWIKAQLARHPSLDRPGE